MTRISYQSPQAAEPCIDGRPNILRVQRNALLQRQHAIPDVACEVDTIRQLDTAYGAFGKVHGVGFGLRDVVVGRRGVGVFVVGCFGGGEGGGCEGEEEKGEMHFDVLVGGALMVCEKEDVRLRGCGGRERFVRGLKRWNVREKVQEIGRSRARIVGDTWAPACNLPFVVDVIASHGEREGAMWFDLSCRGPWSSGTAVRCDQLKPAGSETSFMQIGLSRSAL